MPLAAIKRIKRTRWGSDTALLFFPAVKVHPAYSFPFCSSYRGFWFLQSAVRNKKTNSLVLTDRKFSCSPDSPCLFQGVRFFHVKLATLYSTRTCARPRNICDPLVPFKAFLILLSLPSLSRARDVQSPGSPTL